MNLVANPTPEELITDIITELTAATRSADEISLLPLDLNTTNSAISSILDVTEEMNITVNEVIVRFRQTNVRLYVCINYFSIFADTDRHIR